MLVAPPALALYIEAVGFWIWGVTAAAETRLREEEERRQRTVRERIDILVIRNI
jgi:hypothetical protein